MGEIYDVVDEKDNVTGEATWTEVHAKGLLHRTVAILVFKDKTKKELLIQKRSQKMTSPGKWENPGGHVQKGDTYFEAVKKELNEELFSGKSLPDLEIREVCRFLIHDYENNFEKHRLFETYCPGPFYLDHDEVSEVKFVNFDWLLGDIEKNPGKYSNAFKIQLKEYKKQNA